MLRTLQRHFLKNALGINKRGLWQWVDDTFNSVDDDRIKEVGPNMACAEWLMKNGAQVRWKGCKEYVNHYDCLPAVKCRSSKQFQIEQVYAGHEASISHLGFRYFENCESITDVTLVGCQTIEDQALNKLDILKNNLGVLKINGCLNVSENGVKSLKNLKALKHLELKNLQLSDEDKTINSLKASLPECDIVYEQNLEE